MDMKRITLTVALATVLSVAPVLADQPTAVVPDPDRAAQLREQAEALFSQPRQWKKAVRLLEQSAELRSADDAQAYDCLLYAGRIRAAIGDFGGARSALLKAADHAMARGAIIDAANALIDAAHASVELKDATGVRELVARATLLTASPQLSVEQRTALKERLSV